MHAIFRSLPGLIDELPDDAARDAIVAAMWPTVLGQQLRERSAVVGLKDNVLGVAVSSAEWKREFETHAAEIVYKLNRALGSSIVRRIELKVNRKSVEDAQSETDQTDAPKTKLAVPASLKEASAKIGDIELRTNFLEAAAVCIQLRDAK